MNKQANKFLMESNRVKKRDNILGCCRKVHLPSNLSVPFRLPYPRPHDEDDDDDDDDDDDGGGRGGLLPLRFEHLENFPS